MAEWSPRSILGQQPLTSHTSTALLADRLIVNPEQRQYGELPCLAHVGPRHQCSGQLVQTSHSKLLSSAFLELGLQACLRTLQDKELYLIIFSASKG